MDWSDVVHRPWKEAAAACEAAAATAAPEACRTLLDELRALALKGPDEWLTSRLRRQVPLATRFAAAAAASLDDATLAAVALEHVTWCAGAPTSVVEETVSDLGEPRLRRALSVAFLGSLRDAVIAGHDDADEIAQQLVMLGTGDTLDDLRSALKDPHPTVRGLAAFGVAAHPEGIGEVLALWREDPDEDVRTHALLALGASRVPDVLPVLLEAQRAGALGVETALLAHGSTEALEAAYTSIKGDPAALLQIRLTFEETPDLSAIRTSARIERLRKDLRSRREDRRHTAATLIGMLRAGIAEGDLRTALSDPSEIVRSAAVESLGLIGAQAAEPDLLAIVEKGRGEAPVSEAAIALGRLGSTRAVPALAQRLDESRNPLLRRDAASALGIIGDHAASPALVAALGDADEQVRVAAATALGSAGEPAARAALRNRLGDSDDDVRAAAARSLARLGAVEDAPPIAALVGDPSPDVVRAAREALWRLAGSESRAPAPSGFEDLLDAPWSIGLARGRERMASLSDAERSSFVLRLVEARVPGDRSWITDVLGRQVAMAAVLAARSGGTGAEERVASCVVTWAGGMSKDVVASVLSTMRAAPSPLADRIARGLVAELGTADDRRQARLCAAVAQLAIPAALPLVLELAASRKRSRRRLGVALLTHFSGQEAATGLRRALGDVDYAVRLSALSGFASRTPPDLIERVAAMTADPSWLVRLNSVAVIVQADTVEALDRARALLASPDGLVRACAAAHLAARGHEGAAEILVDSMVERLDRDDEAYAMADAMVTSFVEDRRGLLADALGRLAQGDGERADTAACLLEELQRRDEDVSDASHVPAGEEVLTLVARALRGGWDADTAQARLWRMLDGPDA